ncbi:hypothetical protein EV385_3588 [Krasilnikovia cinnamomea]|uniref:4-amino-4-deoxy-L-arabinose transferase-like glycosyltransferase n=1 Tax=Krasilnikovia cinnamomea TaxID=349313 RepID=A0A4Q7ZN21_9ACTN|nr:hypothetical protein [Krasilnikovia cinnamomea]RZU51755.1 hypothetical protein EV385_3588 [Krasilnikovia cinnamomea]
MTAAPLADVADRESPARQARPTGRERWPRRVRSRRHLLAVAPWPVVAVVGGYTLHATGTPAVDAAAYASYWALCVVLPGTLVFRALRGSRGNLPEDLGLGAATGLVLELAAWAVSAAAGWQPALRWWPVPVVVAFLAVPRLRRHWRIGDRRPLPVAWSWLMAVVVLLIVGWAGYPMLGNPLPPATAVYYQDLMYHLALVRELTRTMPFEVPQLAGQALRYHYLSDAHMATASMITGVPASTVLLRLWMVPILATAAFVVAVLGRDLAGRWWAGPAAAGAAFVGLPVTLGAPGGFLAGSPAVFASPSQMYALPLAALLVVLAVDVLRGRPLGWGWTLVPALAFACAGAKSSILPPLVVGVVLAGVVVWWRARAVSWPVLGLFAALVGAMALGFRVFAGGGAGTLAVQALAALDWMAPYQRTLGLRDGPGHDGLVLPSAAGATGAERWFIVWVVGWWLLTQTPRLLGLAALGVRPTRGDPAAWLLAGVTLAGVGGTWLLWHPSSSQVYFFTGVVPFGAVLTVWLLATLTAPGGGWQRVAALVGAAVGALWGAFAPRVAAPGRSTVDGWAHALAVPAWRAAAGLAVLLVVVAVLGRAELPTGRAGLRRVGRFLGASRAPGAAPERRAVARLVAATAVAAVLGCGIGTGAAAIVDNLRTAQRSPVPLSNRLVTAAEMRAAQWLDAHAGLDDVVATNVHCQPVRTRPGCDARAFWVAGLGGRRTLVESWGYSDAAVAANGVGDVKYMFQPPPDPAVYALNERAFTAPTTADLAELRRVHRVRWLFADRRAGPVSPQLPELAVVRLTDGPVTIYELR